MEAKEVLCLNILDKKNKNNLLNAFNKNMQIQKKIKDSDDSGEMVNNCIKYLKYNDIELINMGNYAKGAKFKLVDFKRHKIYDINANTVSAKEAYIKAVVYQMLQAKVDKNERKKDE